jgi:hypothetical protein
MKSNIVPQQSTQLIDKATLDSLKDWLKSQGIKSDNLLTLLKNEESANPKTIKSKITELV